MAKKKKKIASRVPERKAVVNAEMTWRNFGVMSTCGLEWVVNA